MKVLVLGNGGREHALAWKLRQSRRVDEVLVAPGNAGTATEPGVRNVEVAATEVDALIALARREEVGLTIVGPEAPLALGVVDRFRDAGLRIFGPRRAAAQLEASKAFAKQFLLRNHIPTAQFAVFETLEPALAHVRRVGAPIVVKADGLAAGKGVVVAFSLADAELALRDFFAGALGAAGARVVVEEFLEGEEASYIALCDGLHALPLATSQDHKRRDDADLGPNTGGMGAYSPAPVVDAAVDARVRAEVIEPTLRGMRADGAPFLGFLYAGLMIDREGRAKVLEYNVRFGDPETQPILMRLRSDLVELVDCALDGRLARTTVDWDPRPAVGVVIAAHGYPGTVRRGDPIDGLAEAAALPDVKVFHAGTALDAQGRVVSAGGRVLTVCALGDTVEAAQQRAYEAVRRIRLPGGFHRRDIAFRAIERERAAR